MAQRIAPNRQFLFPLILALAGLSACREGGATSGAAPGPAIETRGKSAKTSDPFSARRRDMVAHQLRDRGIADARVLEAMARVPRHLFVPDQYVNLAYEDSPLPIGLGQTISQPYIVAFMTEQGYPQAGFRALEVGTGSGYQAAVLSRLVQDVYTIELLAELGNDAAARLRQLGFRNVHCRIGDGYQGWPEAAPFDLILVTAAPESVPAELVRQLRPGGRMIIPVGLRGEIQSLIRIEKDSSGGVRHENLLPVRFVPLVRGGSPRH